MPLKNYTTEVEPETTSGQLIAMLATKGARHVSIHYDESGKPTGLQFMVIVESRPLTFNVPVKHKEVKAAVDADKKIEPRYKRGDYGRRIAWRLLKDWVEVQMAFVECGQAELAEVFLPYAIDRDGLTAYQSFKTNLLRLPAQGETGR
jgi:hypothetical protein